MNETLFLTVLELHAIQLIQGALGNMQINDVRLWLLGLEAETIRQEILIKHLL